MSFALNTGVASEHYQMYGSEPKVGRNDRLLSGRPTQFQTEVVRSIRHGTLSRQPPYRSASHITDTGRHDLAV